MAEHDASPTSSAPWIAALLLLVPSLSILFGVRLPGPAAQPVPSAMSSPAPSPSPPRSMALASVPGFVQVLADFLGMDARGLRRLDLVNDDGDARRGAPERLDALEADIQRCTAGLPTDGVDVLAFRHLGREASRREFHIEHLIATIPDPVRSRLALNFDRNLDAIQRAAGTAGYSLDRFALPWPDDTADRSDRSRPSRFETEPGALLFRKDSDALLVLLVGETPTAGIHRLALRKALELVHAVEEPPDGAGEPVPIRVLGPSFTGSAPSLSDTLAEWRKCGRSEVFEVVTGSATAVDRGAFLDGMGRPPAERVQDSFLATINPDQPWRLPGLLGAPPGQVAFLTESNTGFGRQVGRRLDAWRGRLDAPHGAPSLHLTFPLAVSSVRTAYEKQRRSRAPSSEEDAQRALPLFLDETADASDVPTLHSPLSPHSTELVLSQLLDTIAREGIRYVVLVATDVRDTLFLAREVRTHCPNTSLVVLEADLLFLHPDVIQWTEGMLVLTPYPLAGWPQTLADPERKRPRLQFASSTTEGVYNAALSFLSPRDLLDYGPPLLEDSPPGIDESSGDGPPLWWAVVARSGFVPLRYLADAGSSSFKGEKRSPPGRPVSLEGILQSESGVVFSFGVFLLVGVVAGASLAGRRPPTRSDGASLPRWRWAADVFGDAIDEAVQPERRLYQLALVLSLSSFGFVAAVAYLTPWWFRSGSSAVWQQSEPERLLILVAAALSGAAVLRGLWDAFGRGSGSRRWLPRFLACVAVAALVAGLAALRDRSGRGVELHVVLAVFVASTLLLCLLAGPLRRIAERARRADAGGRLSGEGDAGLGTIGPILVAMSLTACLSTAYGHALLGQTPFGAFAWHARAADPSSGVSPLVPLLLVSLSAGLWALGSLRRLRLHERLRGRGFLGFAGASSRGLGRLEAELAARIGGGGSRLPFAPIALALLAVSCYRLLWNRTLAPPFEPSAFNWLFSTAFFFVYFAVVLMFLRFVGVWAAFSRLLRAPALSALDDALKALRPRLSWVRFLELTGPVPKLAAIDVALERAEAVQRDLDAVAEAAGGPVPVAGLSEDVRLARDAYLRALARDAAGDPVAAAREHFDCDAFLAKAAGRVSHALDHVERRPLRSEDARKTVAAWRSNAEQVLAARVAGLAILVISVLRSLIAAVSLSVLLMLLAVSWYPFQNKELLLTFNWCVILAIGAGTLWVFVQMDRDEVLSYLAGSEPGKLNLNRDFLLRLLTYGAIPLMTMLAVQFPGAGAQISSWIQRLLGAAH